VSTTQCTRRHTGGCTPASVSFSWKILIFDVIRRGAGLPACSQPGATQRRAGVMIDTSWLLLEAELLPWNAIAEIPSAVAQ
jgi:hypothetical protein